MLGTVVGGALAGPSVAKQAVAEFEMQRGMAMPMPAQFYAGESDAKDVSQAEWNRIHIAKLKRLASGEITDEDMANTLARNSSSPFGALKSISDEARNFMQRRHYERQWRNQTIANAKKALADYDKTGLLRHVL